MPISLLLPRFSTIFRCSASTRCPTGQHWRRRLIWWKVNIRTGRSATLKTHRKRWEDNVLSGGLFSTTTNFWDNNLELSSRVWTVVVTVLGRCHCLKRIITISFTPFLCFQSIIHSKIPNHPQKFPKNSLKRSQKFPNVPKSSQTFTLTWILDYFSVLEIDSLTYKKHII